MRKFYNISGTPEEVAEEFARMIDKIAELEEKVENQKDEIEVMAICLNDALEVKERLQKENEALKARKFDELLFKYLELWNKVYKPKDYYTN